MPDAPRGDAYARAGVDVAAADRLVREIAPLAASTHDDRVLAGVGPFAGLMRAALAGGRSLREPLLAAACDGVGTKLLLASRLKEYRILGRDLVAMSINDLVTLGAEPVLFLDYIAAGKLDPEAIREVVAGVSDALGEIGCPLLGGETAEMPGLYRKGHFDIAGFAVGMVDAEDVLGPARVSAGDQLIGLPSVGPHANGFSLVREVIADLSVADLRELREDLDDGSLAECLLAPTLLYVDPMRALLERMGTARVHAAAHITGGGIAGNLARIIPDGLCATVSAGCWPIPRVFHWLAAKGAIEQDDMRATFNMGLGMVVVVGEDAADDALEAVAYAGRPGRWIGAVEAGGEEKVLWA